MKKIITSVLAFQLMIGFLAAQQANFSGSWNLKEKIHVTGPEYINALPTKIKVDQRSDSLIIESTNPDAEGREVTSRQAISMDGKPSTIISATSKRKYIRSLAWSTDKKSLILTTAFYIPENENEVDFTRAETWTLKVGQLNINKRSIETRSETWEVNGVFEKK